MMDDGLEISEGLVKKFCDSFREEVIDSNDWANVGCSFKENILSFQSLTVF